MVMEFPTGMAITNLMNGLKSRTIRAVDLVKNCFDSIATQNPTLHAFLDTNQENALAQAHSIDTALDTGNPTPPLSGIPIGIKDNIAIAGAKLTCGSRILANYHSPYSATVIEKLTENGAIIIGKTNMDEFAMGSSTENSAFGPTRNPYAIDRVPGGSSGGSAAAVASGMVPCSLGSDTGGSIRQPAAFCGVTGLKPTYGRVSRYGLVAFASSLDQIGPFTRSAEDAAHILTAIAGPDIRDATSVRLPISDFITPLDHPISGLRIGVDERLLTHIPDPEFRHTFESALDVLRGLDVTIVPVDLSAFDIAVPTYYILAPAEASSNLARFDGVRYGLRHDPGTTLADMMRETRGAGFGPEVKRRILLGTFALSSGYYDAYYGTAQKARSHITATFNTAFESCDVIATPTTPTPAFRLGELTQDPWAMYLSDILTIPVNLAGLPGISIPCGFVNGLPAGLQLIGKWWEEAQILQVSHAYQTVTDWHKFQPQKYAASECQSQEIK